MIARERGDIREKLGILAPNDELSNSYVRALDRQETETRTFRREIADLQGYQAWTVASAEQLPPAEMSWVEPRCGRGILTCGTRVPESSRKGESAMSDPEKLNKPWMVAVWPGMGNVAVSAGYYLMAKLGMHQLAELPAQELFDVEHVEVKGGIIRPGRLPRSRFFAWRDPSGQHDLVVFIGEAQPPLGKYAFCRQLIEYAKGLGVERIVTFAAMGTQMHPSHDARVFAAATDQEGLAELSRHGLEVLEDGQIGGLNGVLLGAAAEAGMYGACLLGEMPHIFAQFPFPKASQAVLEAFTRFSGIEIDLTELSAQAREMDQQLGELLAQMEQTMVPPILAEEEAVTPEPAATEQLAPEDAQHLDGLFERAASDRSVAYELKRELDRLGVYREYEDRFLDLFKSRDDRRVLGELDPADPCLPRLQFQLSCERLPMNERYSVSRRRFLGSGTALLALSAMDRDTWAFADAETNPDGLVAGIERGVVFPGRKDGTTWFHPRPCMVPSPDGPLALMTLQSIGGSDVFGPVHVTTSTDLGRSWSRPEPITGLGRRDLGDDWEVGVCDVVPEFHPPTSTVLAVGHNVYYRNGVLARPQRQRWPVYVVRSSEGHWSEPHRLEWDDPRATAIYTCGCSQRVVLDEGDLLIPLSFGPKGRTHRSVTTVRCAFDGRSLKIRRVGNELVNTSGRGLLEPSLTNLNGRFYLTIRAEDDRGYLSVSDDGLHWDQPRPWCWDDGEPLVMSTTQQHWLPHSDGLFLIYTRKAEANVNVMRWRAPLYMAEVDRKALRLIRSSERVVLPMIGDGINNPAHVARMGNFHTVAATPGESWVTVGETLPSDGWRGDTLLARIQWSQPNRLVRG